MAVADTVKISVSDDSGDIGSFGINLPTTYTKSQLDEWAVAQATALDKILDGRVESFAIRKNVDISGLTSNTPTAISDVEELGAFTFLTTNGRKVHVNVPAISEEDFVNSGTDELNQVIAAVAAFISMFEDGLAVTGGTILPCDIGEDDIVSTLAALEIFRSSGRRQ